MRSISALKTDSLIWAPVGRRSYQLSAGDDLVATLDWATSTGSLATGEAADGNWTFKRVGFFRPSVTVRDRGGPHDLAVMRKVKGVGLVMEFAAGPRFTWALTRERRREVAFHDASGTRADRLPASIEELQALRRGDAGRPGAASCARSRSWPWSAGTGWFWSRTTKRRWSSVMASS